MPIAVAKCVLPTPDGPRNTIFSFLSINPNDSNSNICALFTDGWKSKSKSLTSLIKGNAPTLTIALIRFVLR